MKMFVAIFFGLFSLVSSMDLMNNNALEIIPDRFEMLQEDPEKSIWDLKVRKVNRQRVIVGSITCSIPFGNNLKMEIKVLRKQGGEYRYLPYAVPPTPFCDVAQKDKYFYPDFAKGSDFPADINDSCPVAIGYYNVYNVSLDLKNVPSVKQIARTGEYGFEITFLLDGKPLSKYRIYCFVNNN